jgi:type II secretion system protein E
MIDKPQIIKEALKNIGVITEEQLNRALETQSKTQEPISEVFVNLGIIKSEGLLTMLSSQVGIVPTPILDLKIFKNLINIIPTTLLKQHKVIPMDYQNNILTIATPDILNFLSLKNLSKMLNYNLQAILIREEDFRLIFERYYGSKGEKIELIQKTKSEPKLEKTISDDAPIIKLVSFLINQAHLKRVSDIHIEPFENEFRIRYRIDGLLQEVPGPPKSLQGSIISRIKIMAGMDIAEKRLPQDGRIRFRVSDKGLDLRVSTLPGIHGESIVLRILDKSSFLLGLDQLGFLETDREKFEKLIQMPNGMILVTGPTGSGKTTTLYAALNQINKKDRKIITVEDPVEYQLVGINQVQVKPQIGLTFASGLRSMLRQAPDIIMVGEIRDFETASIATQAALTGHLILSTLHTNDAPGTITRLIDMGLKPYLVASTLQAVLAQRLIRTICPKCKEPYLPNKEELIALRLDRLGIKEINFYRGRGCEECSQTGYRGRIGIFELLSLNDELRELIVRKVSVNQLKENSHRMGTSTLREDGIKKILNGSTTIKEVLRVTQSDVD